MIRIVSITIIFSWLAISGANADKSECYRYGCPKDVEACLNGTFV